MNHRYLFKAARLFVGVIALAWFSIIHAQVANYADYPWRIEILSLASKTYTSEEFLRGGAPGKDVTIGGELRLPFAVLQGKVPAVVLIHGSGGISSNDDSWAHALNQAGIAAFILDSFSGRGIVNTVEDQTQLDSLAIMYDAYRALDLLAAHRLIRPDRIAVMGFSKGGVASVFSADERFRKMYGGKSTFVAHVGLYTPCNTRFADDTKVGSAPIRLFHGTTDDYVSAAPCRTFVADLKAAGADATLVEFPDTWHAYDVASYPPSYEVKTAQSTRNCRIEEGSDHKLMNAETNRPFNQSADPCVVRGVHIGYNPASTQATQREVLSLLRQAFQN